MDLDFSGTLRLFEEFKRLSEQPNPPLEKCRSSMDRLKLAAVKLSFSPLDGLDASQQQKQLLLSREILEHGAYLSIQLKDIPSFERFFSQLKTFYNDYKSKLPPTHQQLPISGLNLLRLLTKNRLDEFHTEIELLPQEALQTRFIQFPLLLEQYMMEGAYNKVLSARGDVPAQPYTFFMDILMTTVRDELAGCAEKAYRYLSVIDAQKMLGFANAKQLEDYASQRGWTVKSGLVSFPQPESSEAPAKADTSFKLIRQTLTYARELERIV